MYILFLVERYTWGKVVLWVLWFVFIIFFIFCIWVVVVLCVVGLWVFFSYVIVLGLVNEVWEEESGKLGFFDFGEIWGNLAIGVLIRSIWMKNIEGRVGWGEL